MTHNDPDLTAGYGWGNGGKFLAQGNNRSQPGIKPGHQTWNLTITRLMPWRLDYCCPPWWNKSCYSLLYIPISLVTRSAMSRLALFSLLLGVFNCPSCTSTSIYPQSCNRRPRTWSRKGCGEAATVDCINIAYSVNHLKASKQRVRNHANSTQLT